MPGEDVPSAAHHTALPACTLGSDDGRARLRRWQQLAERAAPSAHRDGHRLEVRYPLGAGVRAELEDLAAAEAQCCSFASWQVDQDADALVLLVSAKSENPDDVAPFAAHFGAE